MRAKKDIWLGWSHGDYLVAAFAPLERRHHKDPRPTDRISAAAAHPGLTPDHQTGDADFE